jgi:ABC-type branched-subunit amino acid transport system substrate-binding protein
MYRSSGGSSTPPSGTSALVVVSLVVMMAASLACISTAAGASTGTSESRAATSKIPASAFQDFTGVTAKTVSIANISTKSAGLFTGAAVGTEAYADYVNARGGINGRRILVDGSDDQFTGALNKQLTEEALQKDFALVGGFSLEDSFGGTVVKANPGFPDVSEVLDPTTNTYPNVFNVDPPRGGWVLGPLAYFQKEYPADVLHVGTLIAGYGSAEATWTGEEAAMHHLGYKVVYDPTYPVTQTDFTQNVVAMKQAGVKILFLEQMPENYAAALVQNLNQQGFHPVLVFGASAYSEALIPGAGGASAMDGAYLNEATSLYLGEDRASLPGVATFLTWVQKASPGFKPDLYTLSGWLSAELFAEALDHAGAHPSRGSELRALRSITSFTGGYLAGTSDPSAKLPTNCYVIARVVDGRFQRVDDPPVTGPTHGYRCDRPYYYPPG